MARYTGPKSKIARKFREAIYGPDKVLTKKNYPPGQHGQSKKRAKKELIKTIYPISEKQNKILLKLTK
jgi:small subunit ribosomal protein S4